MSDLETIFKSLNSSLAEAVEKGLRIDGKPGKPTASSPDVEDAVGDDNSLTSQTDAGSPDGNYAKLFGKNFVGKAEFIPVAKAVLELAKAFKKADPDNDGDEDGPVMKMLTELSAGYATINKALAEGVLPRLEKAEAGGIVRKSMTGQDFAQGAGDTGQGFDGIVRGMVNGARVRIQ